METESLDGTTKNVEHVLKDGSKKKRKKKIQAEGDTHDAKALNMNGTNDDAHSASKKLKRDLPFDENRVTKKKGKANHTSELFNGDVHMTECHEQPNKHHTENLQKHIENKQDDDGKSNNENSEDEQVMDTEAKKFTGKYLRNSFNSAHGLDTLRKFVKICTENKERDTAAEYLQAGGSVLEILRLLNATDKKNTSNTTHVFSAIQILIMKILAQYPQYQSSAEEACRHLINSHLSLIHSMLSVQSNTKQRKVVLCMLAAMVSLGGNLPRELLAHLTFQPQVLESLVRHTKPTDSKSVRTCFIHFVLAFLVEGNLSIIRALLDKRGLLSSIFPDLMYDSRNVVNLVLTTVKNYVLENPGISKTTKLHVFSTSVIQNLVCLYNWKGPNNWTKNKFQGNLTSPEYLEEKEAVTSIVHDFLIILLTSYRYGIAFHDRTLGTSRAKHNQLVNTVLQSLDHPWEHEKPSDLVIRIMAACPDLIKPQISLLEPYIEPRVSIKWITLMTFIRKIIESVDAEICLKTCSLELNASNLAGAVMSLIVPQNILKSSIVSSLTHDSKIVRHEAILLLTIMFNKIRTFSSAVKRFYGEDIDFSAFKNHVTDYIVKNIPNLDMILKVWSCTFVPSPDTEGTIENDVLEPKTHDHLNAILNLLHLYSDICPELLDAPVTFESSMLLTPLNKLDDNTDELNKIKIKAIQFLLAMNPTEFAPQKEIFNETLTFLISVLDESASTFSYKNETIKTLLYSTGMFEGCSDQLDIWINSFINLKTVEERDEVTTWFIGIIKNAVQHTEKYINRVIQAEEMANEEVVYTGTLDEIFDELYNKDNINENSGNSNTLFMQRSTSVSPLLCCMLHKMKKNSTPTLLSYVSYILLHTLHYQIAPRCLIHLAKNLPELPVQKYLQSWLEENHPIRIKKIFPSMAMIHQFSSAMLTDAQMQLNEIFTGDSVINFKYNDEEITLNYTLSEYEITYLFKMTTFYLAQFAKRGVLSEHQNNNCKMLLLSLLHIAKEVATENSTILEECSKCVFTHPIILEYFSPLNKKKNNSIKEMMVHTILDVCKTVVHLNEKRTLRNLFLYFKNKLFSQLYKMIEKKQETDKVSNPESIAELLELFQLTSEDIISLLNTLVKLEKTLLISKDSADLSVYGHIIPKLLEIVCSESMKSEHVTFCKLDAEFVRTLYSHLLFLKTNSTVNVDNWERVLSKYLSLFPHNIAGITANNFSLILPTRSTDSTVKLISLLISKNPRYVSIFANYVTKPENIGEADMIFSVMSTNLTCKWNEVFLQELNKHYQQDITSYLCDPNNTKSWIEPNISVICYLIGNTFDLALCEETCNALLQIGDKLDMVSICYVRALESLYIRYATLKENNENPIMDLVQVFLRILTLTLKKESKNTEKLTILCESMNNAIKRLRQKETDFTFESLSTNHSWSQFTRFSLKLGLKESKDNKQVPILTTLNILCDIAYKNNSDNEYVKTLFEMATSHSEFVNIMLGSSSTKRHLIELLWILMQKDKSVMALTHVPLYLAAYNATLNEADQFILKILQYYEKNNMNVYEYRPYLWGNAAAIHYSVKGETDMALWRQPSISQVLNLFETEIVNNTIKCYPVHRALKNNDLCQSENVYDPAFYLPLLSFLLSENNIVPCHRITQCGALALVFAACGSSCSDVRMVAYTVISRYYSHLESASSKSKLLWMRLIDSLRYGIISLESELSNVRLSCLVSTFLAQTSLIATEPLHPLFSPLQNFLMAKPALNVKTIPEFLHLFHSSDVQYKAHRYWILDIIHDGMKTENDVEIAFKCVLFKMLQDFYTCILSDTITKKLILEIICATSTISKAALLLIEGHGLLPWLLEVVKNLHTHDTQFIDVIINITGNLLNALPSAKGGLDGYRCILLQILLNLKTYLPKDIKICSFTLYVKVLQKLLIFKHIQKLVTKEDLQQFLDFSKGLLGNVDECADMLLYGCKYVTDVDILDTGDELSIAKKSLKAMVWTWCNHYPR